MQTDDNASDYYRSTSGVLPVRWTAPEGLTLQKFSSASDVWSFGIVCVEIFQDGQTPYASIRSNPAVMALVTGGKVHPKLPGCTQIVWDQLVACWSFHPKQRPGFAALKTFFRKEMNVATMIVSRPVNHTFYHCSRYFLKWHKIWILRCVLVPAP